MAIQNDQMLNALRGQQKGPIPTLRQNTQQSPFEEIKHQMAMAKLLKDSQARPIVPPSMPQAPSVGTALFSGGGGDDSPTHSTDPWSMLSQLYSGSNSSTSRSVGAGPASPLPDPADLVTISTAGGPITVSKTSAPDMKGFVDDLVAAGAPVHNLGSYNPRHIAGTNIWSKHASGDAIDWDQSARNVVSPEFKSWASANQDTLNAIMAKHNMVSGANWKNPDLGHFERKAPTPGPQSSLDPSMVRGSWFNDRTTASGLSAATTPGIALPAGGHMGDQYRITPPPVPPYGGNTVIAPLIDRGPGIKGRGADFSYPLINQMYPGMDPKQFPTDSYFKVEPYTP